MTSKDAVTVVVRMTAIWLFFRAFQYFTDPSFFSGGKAPPAELALWLLFYGAVVVAVAAGLWLFASRVAGLLLPRDASTAPTMPFDVQSFQQAAFSVLGLYLVATAVPSLGYYGLVVFHWLNSGSPDGFNPAVGLYPTIVRLLLQIGIGLYLLVGAAGLAALVQRMQGMPAARGDDKP